MFTSASIPMICTYDSEADAAYINFKHPIADGEAERTATFDTTIGMFNLDLGPDGHVIGLEILGARQHLPPALLAAIMAGEPAE
jgi:uncharacterized protein YuzE